MSWDELDLWADEEQRLHTCMIEALRRLINQRLPTTAGELTLSAKLRPLLIKVKKEMKLAWTLHPEASSFSQDTEDAPKPIGHPDFRFSQNTPTYDQYDYDYDIECKLVRVKRQGKSHNYCEYYVIDGIKRFQDCTYAQSLPPMGTMIGYLQEGDTLSLLTLINHEVKSQCWDEIVTSDTTCGTDVLRLAQNLKRTDASFVLHHLWADLRG